MRSVSRRSIFCILLRSADKCVPSGGAEGQSAGQQLSLLTACQASAGFALAACLAFPTASVPAPLSRCCRLVPLNCTCKYTRRASRSWSAGAPPAIDKSRLAGRPRLFGHASNRPVLLRTRRRPPPTAWFGMVSHSMSVTVVDAMGCSKRLYEPPGIAGRAGSPPQISNLTVGGSWPVFNGLTCLCFLCATRNG